MKDTSYLYGTMHVQDKRVFDFKDGVLESFAECKFVALELNPDSMNPFESMMMMIMDSSKTLGEFYTEKEYQMVTQYIEDSVGMPMMLMERLQPMFVTSFIQSKSMGSEMEEALDMHFYSRGKKQGKTIIGLESTQDQMGAINSIPYQAQANDLLTAIQTELDPNPGTDSSQTDELTKYYLEGDLDALTKLIAESEEESTSGDEFRAVFLTKRNEKMVAKLIPLMSKGGVFTAVGAAHLPDTDGIIELLRAKGYTVVAK